MKVCMTSREEALELFHSDDLIDIGMRADEVRRRHHPGGVVSYIVDRAINYSLDRQAVFDKIQETINLGGTGIVLKGSPHPDLKIEWYEDLLGSIKKRFEIHCHCFSALEITNVAKVSGMSLSDTLARLRDAGLDSLPGDGAEVTKDWAEVHRAAHALGLQTTATMMFGSVEERIDQLELIRQIQQDTGGFTAFTPHIKEETTAVEYLKTLAISRIYLDNIVNIQSSWAMPGLKTCQVALRFGGNDVGSIMIGENVVSHHRATEEELRRLIRDAGFIPKQRDTLYTKYFLN
jgi:cyclic dehypoxanthinyl futalosine synthase